MLSQKIRNSLKKLPGRRWTVSTVKRAVSIIYGNKISILWNRITHTKYVPLYTKMYLKCNLCDYGSHNEWFTSWSNVVSNGVRCPNCHSGIIPMKLSMLASQKRLDNRNENIFIYKPFYDAKHHLRVHARCLICGYEWSPLKEKLTALYRYSRCPMCNRIMPRRKRGINSLIDWYIHQSDISIINFSALKKYTGSKNHIQCKCNKCGYIWSPDISDLIQGRGCPRCGHKLRITPKIAISRIKRLFKGRISIKLSHSQRLPQGEYTHVPAKCHVCGYIWYPCLNSLFRGRGCPNCTHEIRLTPDVVKRRVNKVSNGQIKIKCTSLPNAAYTRVYAKCLKCGYGSHGEWKPKVWYLIRGRGCPHCNEPLGEKAVTHYLLLHHLIPVRTKAKLYKTNMSFRHSYHISAYHTYLSYDFMLNYCHKIIAIEFDGVQHFKSADFFGGKPQLKRQHMHDIWKTNWCKTHHIKLIRIENPRNYSHWNPVYKLVKRSLDNHLLLHKVHQLSLF